MDNPIISSAKRLRGELNSELISITKWWATHTPDKIHGGFLGEVSNEGVPRQGAKKGVVLNARILWFFSEASLSLNDPQARVMADRAFEFLRSQFTDSKHGGLFWSINADGTVLEAKKQTYAQAFGIYAFCAYYKLTQREDVLNAAVSLFDIIETRCLDEENNGYHEALSRDWSSLDDVRLSEFDSNYPFSMNTHLHVLEAYTELQKHVHGEAVKDALTNLINIHTDKILREDGSHCRLFFDRAWKDYSKEISHGHDIEASWLIQEACVALDNLKVLQDTRPKILALADRCFETGFAERQYIFNETEIGGQIDKTSIWWVQAEAIVGFLNSYDMTKKQSHFEAALRIWEFTKHHHVDPEFGEWRWSALDHGATKVRPYKCGMWKAPYHNGRAMIAGIRLLDRIINNHIHNLTADVHSDSSYNRQGKRA